jgi:arginine deiminase
MDCVELEDGRPTIPAEYQIDWSGVSTVERARTEHQAFVDRLRQRERVSAGYIVTLEGRVFACADDAAWLRQFFSDLENR